jgi:exodeoxyribonuclease VII large subunit
MLGQDLARLTARLNRELDRATAALRALSPSAVLARGYAICQRERDDAVVASVGSVECGEQIRITVTDGRLRAEVTDACA